MILMRPRECKSCAHRGHKESIYFYYLIGQRRCWECFFGKEKKKQHFSNNLNKQKMNITVQLEKKKPSN